MSRDGLLDHLRFMCQACSFPRHSGTTSTTTIPADHQFSPGNTRIWSAPRHLTSMEDVKLPINKSHFYRDENTVRQPTHPFEPAFRALAASNPAATCADVDIVADEPTLTSLFDFVSGRISVSFRLDLCLVGRTCFVTMRHKPGTGNNDERFEQYDGPMDDLAFLQLATHPPTLDRARTHHRLVRYRIGNMVCAVRSKVGLVYDAAPGEEKTTEEEEEEAPKMDWAKVAQYHAAAASSQSNAGLYKTTVLTGGEGTKTKRTALAVTRHSSEQQSSLAELMPQLWFSRTDYLLEGVIGTNYDAPRKKQQIPVIKGVQLTRAANFFKSWEEENQVALSKLARLLSDFRRLLIRKGGPLTVVIQPRVHYLVVFAPVLERRPLPEDLVVAFWPAEDEKTAEEILLEEEDKEAQYEDHLRSMAQPGACLRPLPCLDRPPSPAEEESSRDQELDEHMRTAHYLQLPTGADDMVDSVEDSQVSSQGSDESMDQDNQSVDQGWQNGDWARYFGGALVDGYLMGDVIQRAYGRYRMSLREQPQTRGDPGGYVSDDESVDDAQTYNNEDDIMDGETIIVRDDSASDDESLKDASEAEAQDGEPQRPQAVRRQDHPDSLKMDQGDTSVIENEDAAFEEYEEEDETENEDADFEEYEDKDDDDYSD